MEVDFKKNLKKLKSGQTAQGQNKAEEQKDDFKGYGIEQEIQNLNSAIPGSLLLVWSGKVDFHAHLNKLNPSQSRKFSHLISLDFFSTQDIKAFQSVPDWPVCVMDKKDSPQGALHFKGKTETKDVIQHFSQLNNDGKKILKGWVTVHDKSQTNFDRTSTLYSDLKAEGKCSLFTLYETFKVGSRTNYN